MVLHVRHGAHRVDPRLEFRDRVPRRRPAAVHRGRRALVQDTVAGLATPRELAQDLELVEPMTRTMLWLYATGTLLLPLIVLVATSGDAPWAACNPGILSRLRPAVTGVWHPAATTPRVLVAAVAVVPTWALDLSSKLVGADVDVVSRCRVWLWFMGFVAGAWLMAVVLIVDLDACPGDHTTCTVDAWNCPETWVALPVGTYSEDFDWASSSVRGNLGAGFFALGHVALCLEGAWQLGAAVFVAVKSVALRHTLQWCSNDAVVTMCMGMLAAPEVLARVFWLPGCFAWIGPGYTVVVCLLSFLAAACGCVSRMGVPL